MENALSRNTSSAAESWRICASRETRWSKRSMRPARFELATFGFGGCLLTGYRVGFVGLVGADNFRSQLFSGGLRRVPKAKYLFIFLCWHGWLTCGGVCFFGWSPFFWFFVCPKE